MLQFLDGIAFREVIWLFPAVVTLHNLEEAIWMPAWSGHVQFGVPQVGVKEFDFAVIVVTVLVYAATYWGFRSRKQSLGANALTGVFVLMLLNVLFPHVLASVFFAAYAPGVVTAVFLILPVTLYLISRSIREQFVKPKLIAPSTGSVVVITGLLLVLLFKNGSAL